MNSFDFSITQFFNQFARRSETVDSLVWLVCRHELFKGALLMALFWKLWFDHGRNDQERGRLISTLISCIPSVLVSRGLAELFSVHARPMFDPELHFRLPYHDTLDAAPFVHSFPSDHAALFFTLSTGLWILSRRMGLFAVGYTVLIICLPRIYLGIHWPTDLLAGAVLGILFGLIGNLQMVSSACSRPLLSWHERRPDVFYAVAFLFTYEISVLFIDLRAIAAAAYTLAKSYL